MSDEGKIENEIINYSVSRGNKFNQTGNERTALMDDDSGLRRAIKVGTREISVSLRIILAAVTEDIIEVKFYKNFPYTIQH